MRKKPTIEQGPALKGSKRAWGSLGKEVVNPWALYEIESKQEWAKEAQSNKSSE